MLNRTHGAQFLVPVVCYPMFKPHEVHDEQERLEIDHKLYLQSPELRRRFVCFLFELIHFSSSIDLELNDLLHQAAFKGGLSRALSLEPAMSKKLSHRQVKKLD